MFGRPPTNFGPPGPFPGPGQFTPFHMQAAPKTGGFLSRIFGGAARPGIGGLGGVPGSNLLGMMNPGGQGFLGTMQNVEKMIQLAQSVRPMIEQFGPMIKNIPSMLEMLKEYKTYSADQDQKKEDNTTIKEESTSTLKEGTKKTETESIKKQQPKGLKVVPKKETLNKPVQKVEYKKSSPKLYI